jgi:hypothetical protein
VHEDVQRYHSWTWLAFIHCLSWLRSKKFLGWKNKVITNDRFWPNLVCTPTTQTWSNITVDQLETHPKTCLGTQP